MSTIGLRIQFIFFLLFLALGSAAQDGFYSQYMFNYVRTNPAYTGHEGSTVLGLRARLQWPYGNNGKLNKPYLSDGFRTLIVAYDTPMDSINSGIGAYLMFHAIDSILKTYYGNLLYAYRFEWGQHQLRLGGGASLAHKTIDASKLGYDPDLMGGVPFAESATILDFTAGLWYQYKKFYTGFSVDRIFQPKFAFGFGNGLQIIRTYYFTSGYTWEVNEDHSLTPSISYRRNAGFSMTELSMLTRIFQKVIFGISYRYNVSVNTIIGFEIDRFRAIIVYDYYQDKFFRADEGGAYELGIAYKLEKPD